MNLNKKALRVFILLGLVSLSADIVYEGGRSISGAYLSYINSPSIAPALIGVGEFIGLVFRLFSGYIAYILQSSLVIWGSTLLGYTLTVLSIPLIGLTQNWEIVVLLYILDRLGKGLRAPARDVIVAEVSEGIGAGKAFGIQELMDQLGAFAGPVLVSVILAIYGYRLAYLVLLVPGLAAIAFVLTAWFLYPRLKSVGSISTMKPRLGIRDYSREFWVYVVGTAALALGFMHWSIASYYLSGVRGLNGVDIGLIYALAMLVDALVAIPLGVLLDKIGYKTLVFLPVLIPMYILILIYAPGGLLYLSAIPWGIIMCSEESIMRAVIAYMVDPGKRSLAYGLYGMVFGLAWALGGYIYTLLLSSPVNLLVYALLTSALSLVLYLKLASHRD